MNSEHHDFQLTAFVLTIFSATVLQTSHSSGTRLKVGFQSLLAVFKLVTHRREDTRI